MLHTKTDCLAFGMITVKDVKENKETLKNLNLIVYEIKKDDFCADLTVNTDTKKTEFSAYKWPDYENNIGGDNMQMLSKKGYPELIFVEKILLLAAFKKRETLFKKRKKVYSSDTLIKTFR